MWRPQALQDTEPINSFVKTKAALCIIRRQRPAKNTRCYRFYVFYQYMLIHPTTITLACNIFMQGNY